jgi:hypothetical protein
MVRAACDGSGATGNVMQCLMPAGFGTTVATCMAIMVRSSPVLGPVFVAWLKTSTVHPAMNLAWARQMLVTTDAERVFVPTCELSAQTHFFRRRWKYGLYTSEEAARRRVAWAALLRMLPTELCSFIIVHFLYNDRRPSSHAWHDMQNTLFLPMTAA